MGITPSSVMTWMGGPSAYTNNHMKLNEEQQKAVDEMAAEHGEDCAIGYKAAIIVFQTLREKHGEGVPTEHIEEEMLCPVCEKAQMKYWISDYNGHVGAHCDCFGTLQQ